MMRVCGVSYQGDQVKVVLKFSKADFSVLVDLLLGIADSAAAVQSKISTDILTRSQSEARRRVLN